MQADTVYRRGGRTGYAPLPQDVQMPGPARPMPLVPMAHPPLTIMDVLRISRLYPDASSQTSGYAGAGYSGTSRPVNSWW